MVDMQKAVAFLLLLAATLSVTIASPRRVRMAEEEQPVVAVEQVPVEERPEGEDLVAEATQQEPQKEAVVVPEVQNDHPAAVSADTVPDVASAVETVQASEDSQPAPAVVDTVNAVEVANAGTDTDAKSEDAAVEPAAKPEEENVVVKESKPEEEASDKQTPQDSVHKMKEFIQMLFDSASKFVGNWGQNDEAKQ